MDFLLHLDKERDILELFEIVADFNQHLQMEAVQFVLNDQTRSKKFKARILLEYIKKQGLEKKDFIKTLKQII